MSKLVIRGGNRLHGDVLIQGSKNSALGILVAAALADGESVLENIPRHSDIITMCHILRELGVGVWIDQKGRFHVDGRGLSRDKPSHGLVRKIRASFYVAGLLLARLGTAEVPLPGGCAIGSRPVDYHLRGFEQLGAKVSIEHGFMRAETKGLVGCKLYVNRASVGTTINLILAASLAEGTTIIENAAKEPEVVDLSIYLNTMGAKIRGAGTEVIKIQGVPKLEPAQYGIIADRVEAGTFMIATAAAGGEVTLHSIVPEHLRAPISKLEEAGVQVEAGDSELTVRAAGRLKPVDVETGVYPGFPTDLQQPFVSMLATADGTSVVRETVFSDRFRFVDELVRMGANIKVEQDTAIIRGVPRLTGAPVEMTDLRAGAAMVVAALGAVGETHISGAEMLDRGYERLHIKLRELGADLEREDDLPESELELSESLSPIEVRG